ncbi:18821_t:CDS:2, partial [Racocetra fulgida]
FDRNFENDNNFNEYITEMEELEHGEMLRTDIQIFEINNPNIDSEDDTRIEETTGESTKVDSEIKVNTS